MNTIIKPLSAKVQDLSFYYGEKEVVKHIDLPIYRHALTALIGPSGCGKTTLLRCFNRIHDLYKGNSYRGEIRLYPDDVNLLDPRLNPVEARMRIGMVFQKPNPFPKSIFENVAYGLKVRGVRRRSELERHVEAALQAAGLWTEVKDRLKADAFRLSGGQQQRLCIARALATRPEILLLDEPTSALDPISTGHIEELVIHLKKTVTIVMVTHNLHQASRVSDYTALMYTGELVEFGVTKQIFTNPREERTEAYITGRFG